MSMNNEPIDLLGEDPDAAYFEEIGKSFDRAKVLAGLSPEVNPQATTELNTSGKKADVIHPSMSAQAALTETRNMNQRLSVMAKLNQVSTAPQSATELATQLGYDGQLTVGALEDGIRIYQRRTVEDCLDLGRCLLLLKEITPHGEFAQRIELLGIAERTAQRFMQAAAKISQNRHLADLSKRVKSVSAILELVTHDDEVLEDFSNMDAIDTMTSSEMRTRLRQIEESRDKEINRLNTDLNIARAKLQSESKILPPPLLSRETDAQMQKTLNAEAMGAAALDLLKRQINEVADGGADLEERVMTLHSCLVALASRVSLAFDALQICADECELKLPARPQMAVSESMARDYLAAHTGYIETAIELAQKALIARNDVLGRGRGRPSGSKNKGAEA